MNIIDFILKLRDHYLREYGLKSYLEINQGYCGEFADEIEIEFPDGEAVSFDYIFDENESLDWVKDSAGNEAYKKYAKSTPPFSKEELIKMPYHIWFYFKGKNYDAECPEGVENFFDLPFYKRQTK